MTKLMQWLCFLGLTFTVWFSLLADVLPIRLSKSAKDVVFPFPVYMVIVFGVGILYSFCNLYQDDSSQNEKTNRSMTLTPTCYSLAVIGYRVLTFNDCEDAAESLRKEIQEARKDLATKGYKFE